MRVILAAVLLVAGPAMADEGSPFEYDAGAGQLLVGVHTGNTYPLYGTFTVSDEPATRADVAARRAHQGVPIAELVWVIVLTKENLWEFLKTGEMERPTEVFGELEMLQLLDQFFDRAIYYAAIGYERAQAAHELPHVSVAQ